MIEILIEILKGLAIVVIPLVTKHIFENFKGTVKGHARLLKDFKFITNFMEGGDIELRNPLIVEQAFYTFFRKRYSYEAIRCLLKYPNPTRAFSLYDKGRNYLEVRNQRIYFEEKYASARKRKWLRRLKYIVAYILVMIFLYSLIFYPRLSDYFGSGVYLQLVIGTFIFAVIGMGQFWEAFGLHCAEALIKKQEKLEGYKS
ncbi:hypothetical protein ACW4YW_04740 [Methylobacillus pratensis]